MDAAARGAEADGLRTLNLIFAWLAVHQLGFAWRGGALREPHRAVAYAMAGFAALIVLERLAGYPVSMVTVPGGTPADATPPTLALLALGVAHIGLIRALEQPLRPIVERERLWAAIVLVNGGITTLYLWHAIAMVLLVGLAEVLGGIGLRSVPNTPQWWLFRMPWLLLLVGVLSGLVALFGRFEAHRVPPGRQPAAWRSVAGAVALCVGLVALAGGGIGSNAPPGPRVWPVAVSLAGVGLVIRRSRG